MKKSLILVPVVAFGLFTGVTNEASAQELKLESKVAGIFDQVENASSVYESAPEIKNGERIESQTNSTYPTKRYKFYYDGSDGNAGILFHPDGYQKLNVLNGNLIKVNNKYDTVAFGLTNGWNYVEIIQTTPMLIPNQPFVFSIAW